MLPIDASICRVPKISLPLALNKGTFDKNDFDLTINQLALLEIKLPTTAIGKHGIVESIK